LPAAIENPDAPAVNATFLWIALIPGFVTLAPDRAYAQLSSLATGADSSDCRSAMRLGPIRCDSLVEFRSVAGERGSLQDKVRGSDAATEVQIDAFLSNYGKPPREAVRALLDPSDSNVRALLRKQEETLAVATFLASRLSELRRKARTGANFGNRDSLATTVELARMRVRLFEKPGDPEAAIALKSLQSLAAASPALLAEVDLVAGSDAVGLAQEISKVPAPLQAAGIAPDDCVADELPFVRIEDLRSGRIAELDARDASADRLQAAIDFMISPADPAHGPGEFEHRAAH
jgi:hypothetical protein